MATSPVGLQQREESLARRTALMDRWSDLGRQIATLEAQQAEVLAERLDLLAEERGAALGDRDMSFRSMAAEYAAAGHIPPATAEVRFTDAWSLVRLFPATHAALRAGLISRRHADVIVTEGPRVTGKPDAERIRAEYEDRVVPYASADTAARTRVRARAVTAALCPETVSEEHRRARGERTITVKPDGEGMAVLTAILPELLAYAVHDRLTALARHVRSTREKPSRRPSGAGHTPPPEQPLIDEPPMPDYPLELDDDLLDEINGLPPWAAASSRPGSHSDGNGAADSDVEPPDGPDELEMQFYLGDPPIDTAEPIPDDADWHDASPIDDRMGIAETDTRSMDQLRADIFADLLLTTDPATVTETALEAMRATVHVTLPSSTLTGADHGLAELEGAGPMLPDAARILAGHASSWDRLFLTPDGMVVATDNYVPTASMKRHLRARDQHCRFPGCRAPAHRCDIDHNHDHAKGGKTALGNLSLFCRAHHALKHPDLPDDDRWTARQFDGGVILWTSPAGRTYADEPPLRVMFV